jgi:DNA-binding transcriptional LysR family regulator
MIETRLLASFVAVAEELHFGKAANRLMIAQPALSRQIRLLEERLGTRLFERTQRRVNLTAAGTLFLDRAHRILGEIEKATAEARRADAGEAGRLSIGFIHSSTYSVTPMILGQFHSRYPDVELVLYEMTIWDQMKALRDHVIDIGILRPPVGDRMLASQTFSSENFIVAVPAQHHLAHRGSVSLTELAGEDFVLFSQRHSPLFHSRIIAMCERAGFVPSVEQHATQIHTIVGLVRANMGISIVPEVARNLMMTDVAFLEIEERPAPVEVALAWRRHERSRTVETFRTIVAELHSARG